MEWKSKLKLDLSLMMIRLNGRKNVVSGIKSQSARLKALGRYLRTRRGSSVTVNPHLVQQNVSVQFEHGTLDIDVIKNLNTDDEMVGRFDLR